MKIAVIGGGVAGLMSALKLQSDGHEVTLIERHEKLAVEATSEQHGWGQFGQLYAHLEDDGVAAACFENIQTLTKVFDLPGNNLTYSKGSRKEDAEGKVLSNNNNNSNSLSRQDLIKNSYKGAEGELLSDDPNNPNSWYRQDLIKYSYKGQPDDVFERVLERKWKMHTQGLENGVNLKKDLVYKTKSGEEVPITPKDLVKAKKGFREMRRQFAERHPNSRVAESINQDKALGIDDYTTVVSHDRPMRSMNILNSALTKFEELGGKVQVNTEITAHQSTEEGVILTDANGNEQKFDKAVYTAGIGLEKLENETFRVNTVISPLLVVKPAISTQNLVKVTPDGKQTINHICHIEPETGQSYSLIGNGDAVAPDNQAGIALAKENIVNIASQTFPELLDEKYTKEVYFGYKTEFQNKKEQNVRNYHYSTASLDERGNVIAAVPGKFTLAPSLAVKVSNLVEAPINNQIIIKENEKENKAEVSKHLHHQIVSGKIENIPMREKRNKIGFNKNKKVSFFNAIDNSQNIKPDLNQQDNQNNPEENRTKIPAGKIK